MGEFSFATCCSELETKFRVFRHLAGVAAMVAKRIRANMLNAIFSRISPQSITKSGLFI